MKLQRDNHGAAIWLGASGLFAEAFGTSYRAYPIGKTLATGVWYHFRLEATLKPTGGTVRVFIDNMSTALVDVSDASTALATGTQQVVGVGLYADAETATLSPFAARFDYASLDWL
jgi:hypothetical protein